MATYRHDDDTIAVEREREVERAAPAAPATVHDSNASAAYDEEVVNQQVGYFESLPTRVNSVLFAVLLALEGLLALRFALVAFGASTTSGFVEFVMDVSWPFVRPFNEAFTNRTWDEGVIEVNTLLAMGVWALAFFLVALLVSAVLPRIDERDSRVSRTRITHS